MSKTKGRGNPPGSAAMTSTKVKAGRRTIELSNAGKVLFPDDGITKAGLARRRTGLARARAALRRLAA